jgi:hypothetical protein
MYLLLCLPELKYTFSYPLYQEMQKATKVGNEDTPFPLACLQPIHTPAPLLCPGSALSNRLMGQNSMDTKHAIGNLRHM